MYCKRCGMDSENTEVCDWCKQPMLAEGPRPPAGAMPESEPESEPELESASPDNPAGEDYPVPYAEDLPPEQRVRPAAGRSQVQEGPAVSDGVRFAIGFASALVICLIAIVVVFLITKDVPHKLYMFKLGPDKTMGRAIFSGLGLGIILGVLLSGLLTLTHLGAVLGVPVGAILGFVSLPTFPMVGLLLGAVVGAVSGAASKYKYKKPQRWT